MSLMTFSPFNAGKPEMTKAGPKYRRADAYRASLHNEQSLGPVETAPPWRYTQHEGLRILARIIAREVIKDSQTETNKFAAADHPLHFSSVRCSD
jgi:hypothetical protein